MSEQSASTHTVLQLCFKVRVSPQEFLAHSREAAAVIATVDGLIWKIWVLEEERSEVGGVYLFSTREAAEAYLKHPAIEAVRNNPAVISVEARLWDVEGSLSEITRAPLVGMQLSQLDAFMAGGW